MLSKLGNVININLQKFKKIITRVWDEIPDEVIRTTQISEEILNTKRRIELNKSTSSLGRSLNT